MLATAKRVVRTALGPPNIEESRWVYDLLRKGPDGMVLEVGAHHGDDTLIDFARDGRRVHAFEPDPANRSILEQAVAAYSNVSVVAKAVADKPGTMTLYRSPESTGISSLAAFTATHAPADKVEVTTLSQYLADVSGPVALLKMDVEGYEKFVLDGYPWDTHRPYAILLEFEDRKTLPLGYSWRDLAEELRTRGYDVLVSEWFPIERYGVEHRWRRISSYPTELQDSNAWGNLVAITGDGARLKRTAHRAVRRLKARSVVHRAAGRQTAPS